ncbi:MAG: hypothetical protein M1820_004125 [Bogoriella megaspora]|nr:MAG: hypothetical protein M1820_004125 [Bogoriella megaspora]
MNQPTTSLLSLPLELRLHIYSLILTQPKPYIINLATTLSRAGLSKPPYTLPALLATNRQIRNEAYPLFYSINRFHLSFYSYHDAKQCVLWLNDFLNEEARDAIRELRIMGQCKLGQRNVDYGGCWVLDIVDGRFSEKGVVHQYCGNEGCAIVGVLERLVRGFRERWDRRMDGVLRPAEGGDEGGWDEEGMELCEFVGRLARAVGGELKVDQWEELDGESKRINAALAGHVAVDDGSGKKWLNNGDADKSLIRLGVITTSKT